MRRNWTISLVLAFVALALFCVPAAWGQVASASLRGTVTDQSGAIIVGATVTLTNTGTNVARTTSTDASGNYLFPIVQVGTYEVTIERQGFQTFQQKGVTLELNQNGRLDASLKLGTATQTVEVTANVAQVDTTGSVLGKVEDQRAINDLPLVGRDTLQLGLLQAGVFAADPGDGSGNPFSVSGQRSESMTFLVNGADNTDFLDNNIAVSPNPDAVQEFKILTNNYDAEYGRTSGGIVNQVTKSGTNHFHGNLFEFLRNDALNANDFLLNAVGAPRSPFKRNVFGGTLGGPIKRDKTFFFASYQGARRVEGETSPLLNVLDQAEQGGDFKELLTGVQTDFCPTGAQNPTDPTFDSGQLFNPTGTATYNCIGTQPGNLGQVVATLPSTVYTNNQVPVEPVIANYIANFLPLPNGPNNSFISSPSATTNEDQGIVRVDQILTPRNTLSFNYLVDNTRQIFPFLVVNGASTGGDVPNGSGFNTNTQNQIGSLTWTHVFANDWTNELLGSINRTSTLQAVPSDKTTPSQLGFGNVSPDDAGGAAPPLLFTPGFTLGPSPQGPTNLKDVVFGFTDNSVLNRGHHEWKFGASIERVRDNFQFDFFNNGSLDFAGFGIGPLNGTFTGNGLADFVGGFPDNFFQFSAATYGIRTTQYYFYGQDTWKVLPRLSLTLGTRYEYYQPPYDIHNELFGVFPGKQSTVFPNAPPTVLYPGDSGTPNHALVFPDRNNFAPRLGFAWDIFGNAKLVMRGGFGVFYDIEDGALNLQYGGQAPFGVVENLFYTPGTFAGSTTDAVSDPFTAAGLPPIAGTGGNNPFPFASRGLTGTFLTPKIGFAFTTAPHFRTPYTEDLNYGFQYQLTPNTMLEAIYVGSLGRKLISSTDQNFPNQALEAQQLSGQGFINADCTRPLAACTIDGNPPSPTDPVTTDANAIPTGALQLLTDISAGLSDSHQLQVTLDKRWSHGFLSRAAYTFGKTIDLTSGFRERSSTFSDPLNFKIDRGLADFDVRHRFVLSGIWELPVGERIKKAKFLNRALGGWQVGSIVTFQAGNPIPIVSGIDSSGFGLGSNRPDVTGRIQKFNPRKVQTFNADCVSGPGNYFFDPTNLVCNSVAQFTFGTLGRNVVIGPGINNYDLSIIKRIKVTESQSVEFRSELFNAFNHTQFESVGRTGDSGTFGQVTTDRGPRLVQFALKYYF